MNSKAYKSYEISEYEYRELKYFCLRYGEMKALLDDCRNIKALDYSKGGAASTARGSPVEKKALKAIELSRNIELIERALDLAADENVRDYLKRAVTCPHISYDELGVPMGRQQFYEMRRRFFYILKRLKIG